MAEGHQSGCHSWHSCPSDATPPTYICGDKGYSNYCPMNIVINEVDINPPGDDSASVSEWVELYNPTDSDVDLSGWSVASTTVLQKTMTISSGTILEPGQFLTYSYQNVWFTDVNESVELRDENNFVIDKTPVISDLHNDFTSWQRIYDGFDSDSSSDWKFVTSTAGSSNGSGDGVSNYDDFMPTPVPDEPEEKPSKIIVTTDKTNYKYGDIIHLTGNISDYNSSSGKGLTYLVLSPTPSDIIGIGQLTLNFDASFEKSIVTGGPLWQLNGDYTVKFQYGADKSEVVFNYTK